jgi:hypothetical protein
VPGTHTAHMRRLHRMHTPHACTPADHGQHCSCALQADICQLGMDQRKVNMLAREYCDQIKRKNKPIILSHRMMPGLLEGQEKMSKSDPNSAIFMEDTAAEVNTKIKKAYCPPQVRAGSKTARAAPAVFPPASGCGMASVMCGGAVGVSCVVAACSERVRVAGRHCTVTLQTIALPAVSQRAQRTAQRHMREPCCCPCVCLMPATQTCTSAHQLQVPEVHLQASALAWSHMPALLPLQVVEGNPCIEYVKYIIMPWFGNLEVKRPENNGGDKWVAALHACTGNPCATARQLS